MVAILALQGSLLVFVAVARQGQDTYAISRQVQGFGTGRASPLSANTRGGFEKFHPGLDIPVSIEAPER